MVARVIVDTTVQEKAVAYPTDSRLLEGARKKLVTLAQRHALPLTCPQQLVPCSS